MKRAWTVSLAVSALLLAGAPACSSGSDELSPGGGEENPGGENGANGATESGGESGVKGDPTKPGTCATGKPHRGFGNVDFAADRVEGATGTNRRRIKPYSALRTEFQRMVGKVPEQLTSASASYGATPRRWYAEPVSGSVSLFSTYKAAFAGCYDMMTDNKYTQAPTAATADAECKALQKKAWQRASSPEETAACVDLLTKGLASEAVARRRWAHACASIMTSAGFTSY